MGSAPLGFTAYAHHGSDGADFQVLWDGGGATLGLPDLFTALRLDRATKALDPLWSAFAIRRLGVDWASSPASLSLLADAKLGPGALKLKVDLGAGTHSLSADWTADAADGSVGLPDILAAVGAADALASVPGLGGKTLAEMFAFSELSLEYTDSPAPRFDFQGVLAEGSVDAFVTLARPSGWAAAAGIVVDDQAKLLALLGPDEATIVGKILDLLSLRPQYLAVSSLDNVTIDLHAPTGAATSTSSAPPVPGAPPSPLADGTLKVKKGLMLGAALQLAGSKNPALSLLNSVTGIAEIDATMSVASGSLALHAAIPGSCTLALGSERLRLTDPYLAAALVGDEVQVQLGGDFAVSFAGQNVTAQVSLAVSDASAVANLDVHGISLPSPPMLPGVRFKDTFGLQIGVDFEPRASTSASRASSGSATIRAATAAP